MVIVQALSNVPVYFKYSDRASSVLPSAIVEACVSALVVIASVPKLNDSAISSRFVLVDAPQVPDSSPVAISFNLKSLVYAAMLCYYFLPCCCFGVIYR